MNAPLDLPSGVCLSEETPAPSALVDVSPETKVVMAGLRRRNQILIFQGTNDETAKDVFTRRRRARGIKVDPTQVRSLIDPDRADCDLIAWHPIRSWGLSKFWYLFRTPEATRHGLRFLPKGSQTKIWIAYFDSSQVSVEPAYIVATTQPLTGYQSQLTFNGG